jgi:hypothetical protein
MSRILRRPMFRGGPVSSYGTGIASGLGYNDGGRVRYSNGGTGLEFLKKAFLGPRFTDPNYVSPLKFQSGTGFEFMSPERQSPGLKKIMQGPVPMDELKLDTLTFPATYSAGQEKEIAASDIEMGEGDLSLTDKDKKGLEEVYKGLEINEKVGDYTGGKRGIDTSKKLTSDIPILQKQNLAQAVSDELSLDEVKDALGYAKARRRDTGDMLASASAAFLGTGGVKEGFAKFMEDQAKKGPGRAEKIETAAATFMLKDKAQSKRDAKNIELMKAKVDYQIQAGEKISLPKAILAANKSGTLNNKELAAGIQGATSPNTGKNYNFKGIVTRDALDSAVPTSQEGDTFILQEKVKDEATGIEKTIKVIIEIIDGNAVPIYRI